MAKQPKKTTSKEAVTEEKDTSPAPETKDVATYSSEEAETVKVRTPEGKQLYNPATKTLYTSDEEGVEASLSDQFVVTNLSRGKLVKA